MPEPFPSFHQVVDIGWFPSIQVNEARDNAAKAVQLAEALDIRDGCVHWPCLRFAFIDRQVSTTIDSVDRLLDIA
jgi:hypothetical protein